MGLFSAGRGEEGGKMGVRDEEEREEGKPGEGVRGVAGLEGGNEDGLEFDSSVELRDSLRKWVYLVFGTSSILKVQFVCFLFVFSTRVHVGASNAIKVSLSQHSKFLSKRTHSHLSVSLCVRAASICLVLSSAHYNAAKDQLLQTPKCPELKQPVTMCGGRVRVSRRAVEREKCVFSAPSKIMLSSAHLESCIRFQSVPRDSWRNVLSSPRNVHLGLSARTENNICEYLVAA